MRVKNLTYSLVVLLAAQACQAAPGMMQTGVQPKSNGPGFWTRVWRGDDAPQPAGPTAFMVQQPKKAWWSPLTDNAMTRALSGGPTSPAAGRAADPLSLQTPAIPLSPKAWVIKAQLAEAQSDFAEARRCLNQALSQAPNDPATLREIGHFEDRREQLAVAEQMYRRALGQSPRDPALLNDLALCCARQGRLQESAGLLANAIGLRPEKTLYRNNIAKVLVELSQQEAAATHLAAVHPPAVAQFNLGSLLAQRGDAEAAAVCFREAAQIDPTLTAATQALQGLPRAAEPQVAAAPVERRAPAQSAAADPAAVDEHGAVFPRLLPPVRN